MEYSESIELYAAPCREIQNEDGVRFAAVIDHSGKKIAGGFKDGITPFEGDEQKLQDFFKIAVELSSKNDNFSRVINVHDLSFCLLFFLSFSFCFSLYPLFFLEV